MMLLQALKYITVLEMTILEKDAQYKKKMLANRVAVLIGTTTSEIIQIYTNMLKYYSYRSESLHEGIRTNISKEELYNLEQYVRDVLRNVCIYARIAPRLIQL